jgi:hypothetical protein
MATTEVSETEMENEIAQPLKQLDLPVMESQFLSLVWKASRIDHQSGEHDDYANVAAGAIHQAAEHKVYNPYAVPVGAIKKNPLTQSVFGRTSEVIESNGIACPIAVGDSGISLGGDENCDERGFEYVPGTARLRGY